jgi:hypothetical protein
LESLSFDVVNDGEKKPKQHIPSYSNHLNMASNHGFPQENHSRPIIAPVVGKSTHGFPRIIDVSDSVCFGADMNWERINWLVGGAISPS